MWLSLTQVGCAETSRTRAGHCLGPSIGDQDLHGLPPALLQVSSREALGLAWSTAASAVSSGWVRRWVDRGSATRPELSGFPVGGLGIRVYTTPWPSNSSIAATARVSLRVFVEQAMPCTYGGDRAAAQHNIVKSVFSEDFAKPDGEISWADTETQKDQVVGRATVGQPVNSALQQ